MSRGQLVLVVPLLVDVPDDALRDEPHPVRRPCQNCGRDCWVPQGAQPHEAAGGFAAVLCTRCVITAAPRRPKTPLHRAELEQWHKTYDPPPDMSPDMSGDTHPERTPE